MVLQAIKYEHGKLQILDQLRLPHEEVYIDIKTSTDAFNAIKSMQVRGAPAIAIVAALSLAVYLSTHEEDLADRHAAAQFIRHQLAFLVTSRPTAVNLVDAAKKLIRVVEAVASQPQSTASSVNDAYTKAATQMLALDVQDNEDIGYLGALWLEEKAASSPWSVKSLNVLTHCNTGSLATAGYGTALGVIRSLHARGSLGKVFYSETRPYNQGSRLTGYELIHDQIPATLITDSMAAALFKLRKAEKSIFAVIVGADRVAANGDTANKIGTYSLAVLARYHGVKFLVAAPRTTIDMDTESGASITIEERAAEEVTRVKGPQLEALERGVMAGAGDIYTISIAAPGTKAWNPAFDVTPAELIDGIVTERGVVEKASDGCFHFESIFDSQSKEQRSEVENGTIGVQHLRI